MNRMKITWMIRHFFNRITNIFLNCYKCDYCLTWEYKHDLTNHDGDMICDCCREDLIECEVCEDKFPPDMTHDMPSGWYCDDCFQSVWG